MTTAEKLAPRVERIETWDGDVSWPPWPRALAAPGLSFFFKQKTAYEIKECDWSSDVCSSDLRRLRRSFGTRPAWIGGTSWEIGKAAGRGRREIPGVRLSFKKKRDNS